MAPILGASVSSLMPGPWQQPQGPLRIDWSRAPRGLTTCFVNNSPVFANLVNGQAATPSNAFLTATARGIAFDPSQGTGNRYVYAPAPLNPSVCSLEALLVYASGDTGGVLATAEGTPTAGTHDRDLFFETGKFNFYIFDGAAKIVTGATTLVAGTAYHVVAVSDGTNILIYVNGALDGTLAAGHAFAGYTSPILVQGYSTEAPSLQGKSPIILANFSTAAWTVDEVKERYLNTFGCLAEAEMPALFVSGGGNVTLTAAFGSFTETGETATFDMDMPAAFGSLVLTGEPATFSSPGFLTAGFGSFVFTGEAATLTASSSTTAVHDHPFFVTMGKLSSRR